MTHKLFQSQGSSALSKITEDPKELIVMRALLPLTVLEIQTDILK